MRVTLIDNYDSFTFNLVHYLGELGADVTVWRNDETSVADVLADDARRDRAVARALHAQRSGHLSRSGARSAAPATPILGVCLGHQAIGQAFGGEVVRAPAPMHGKVSRVSHNARGPVSRPQRPVPGDPLPFARHQARNARRPSSKSPPRATTASSWRSSIASVRCTACSSIPRASPANTAARCCGNFLDLARAFNARAPQA